MALCLCGCGQITRIAQATNRRDGWVKGQPLRFISGHYLHGNKARTWINGTSLSNGYLAVYSPWHPRKFNKGYVFEHILKAEKVLGRFLPDGAVVHHVNENKLDNENHNLVICENNAYHHLLHRRKRAIEAGFPARAMKCCCCHQYDLPENMRLFTYQYSTRAYSKYKHPNCHRTAK